MQLSVHLSRTVKEAKHRCGAPLDTANTVPDCVTVVGRERTTTLGAGSQAFQHYKLSRAIALYHPVNVLYSVSNVGWDEPNKFADSVSYVERSLCEWT